MKKIFFLTLLILVISHPLFSQEKNINHYKYIIVPKHFSFLKKADQYQTSSLTKFLFNKAGFIAFLSDEKAPEDLHKNPCLALTVDVKDASSMIATKEQIVLLDCNKNVVFTSPIGKSKLKEYKRSYHEAIRNAFKSIKSLNYQYQSFTKEPVKTAIVPKTNPIKTTVKGKKIAIEALYAQPIKNGFQLVNSTPTIVFQVLKTTSPIHYILKDKKGILYKKGDFWIAEYYKNGQFIKEKYQIKF